MVLRHALATAQRPLKGQMLGNSFGVIAQGWDAVGQVQFGPIPWQVDRCIQASQSNPSSFVPRSMSGSTLGRPCKGFFSCPQSLWGGGELGSADPSLARQTPFLPCHLCCFCVNVNRKRWVKPHAIILVVAVAVNKTESRSICPFILSETANIRAGLFGKSKHATSLASLCYRRAIV